MLRLGCLGCLTLLILIVVLGFGVWAAYQVTRLPENAVTAVSPADGLRAQQKIFDALRRAGSGRPHTATLSERELNAFLRQHVAEAAGLPLSRMAVTLPAAGRAIITGQMPLRQVFGEAPLSLLVGLLPASWLDRPVWLSLATHVAVETGDGRTRRQLRLDVERFYLGRLGLPTAALRVLLEPAARLLRWPLPDAVDDVRVEPGRLVIQTAS